MNPLTPLARWVGSIPWLPRFLPQITALDKLLQRLSRGHLSLLRLVGLPNLLLIVPGRRSGEPRSTPLLCVPWRGGHLIAGSNFGGARMPVWVHNVRAARQSGRGVRIRVNGVERAVGVRELRDAERDRAWRDMLHTWPNYAKYEARTERTIPVFFLEPTA